MTTTQPVRFSFPYGRKKALVMSFDDGSEHDRRLIDIFNRYGIKATFHLNSGKLGALHHVSPQEIRTLYAGHEVACHSVNHRDLTTLSDKQIRQEIVEDKKALEALFDKPVKGLAYPFGAVDQRLVSVLSELDFAYARTASATGEFDLPENFLALSPSCHHNLAMALAKRLVEKKVDEMALMYVWGHSFELDGFMSADREKNWKYMEMFCRFMQGQRAVFFATTSELVDYLKAINKLNYSTSPALVQNPSQISIWLDIGDDTYEIPPKGELLLSIPRHTIKV